MKELENINYQRKKTISQAFKELIAGYDVIGNLKFLVMAFFGLLGLGKNKER